MSADPSQIVTPIILCGGAGTRLWPLSRKARPKQMLDLTGGGTMLALTAERVADPGLFAAPIVVAGETQAAAIEAALPHLGALILEPAGRNTAPAIALATLEAGEDDLLLVLPSDQLVRDPAGFREAVRRALPAALDGWIVTFGMKAERPETGYGYIERGEALAEGVHVAARFVEKPDAATAEAYLAGGRHDWNGGIFLFRARTMIEALREFAPEVLAAAEAAMAAARRSGLIIRPGGDAFAAAPSVSIDYAVMEKAGKVAVVPTQVGWSDIGSWEALHIVADKDGDDNVVVGPGMALNSKGCLIRSDGPMVAVIGVEDLVVVATGDAVVVVPRSRSQEVKDVVEALKLKGLEDLL
ncbi:MAG TPA: mannose-1-phosphate guanylyltransferase/mannose-6-phosphate isomerase [Allosphingosinicella sp.]|nr:mannose-1-phosphate guanylyltransferase/mannose-6-phosphate isomerase [Allosphingosinicella sp.]